MLNGFNVEYTLTDNNDGKMPCSSGPFADRKRAENFLFSLANKSNFVSGNIVQQVPNESESNLPSDPPIKEFD